MGEEVESRWEKRWVSERRRLWIGWVGEGCEGVRGCG
jgi:hypothetical protein